MKVERHEVSPSDPSEGASDDLPEDLPALMSSYLAGDESAFNELYGRLARSVRGYLRTLVPPGVDVEDSVQNTFLQLHRSRQSYLSGEPVRPWLFAIARHVGLMAQRSQLRLASHEVHPTDELLDDPALARLAGTLDRIALARALCEISAKGREILWLRHAEGLSIREASIVLGISETAAKVRVHRAIGALRERLVEDGIR